MSSPDPTSLGIGGRPTDTPSPAGAVDQPFDRDGLYGLRATLSAHAPGLDISAEQTEHLLIVAGELATNAIRHGGGSGRLRLWRRGDILYCQVSDDGPGMRDPQVGTVPPDQARAGGRGIWICRQLCTELIIDHAEPGPGAVVTAVISLARPAGR